MPKWVLFYCFSLVLLLRIQAQTINPSAISPEKEVSKTESKIFVAVDTLGQLPATDTSWARLLAKQINPQSPVDNGAPAGVYTVVVQFITDKAGIVSDIRALTTNGYGMEEQVVRILKKGPKWTPASQEKEVYRVHTYNKQAVTFHIEYDFEVSPTEIIAGKKTEILIDYALADGEHLKPKLSAGTIRHRKGNKYIVRVKEPGEVILALTKRGTGNKMERLGAVRLNVK